MRKNVNLNIKTILLIMQKVYIKLCTEFLNMQCLIIIKRVGFIRESNLIIKHI